MAIKKKSWEVHFSRIIGIFLLITGLLILFNAPRIKDYNIKDSSNIHINNIWDFFVAFFDELVRIFTIILVTFQLSQQLSYCYLVCLYY